MVAVGIDQYKPIHFSGCSLPFQDLAAFLYRRRYEVVVRSKQNSESPNPIKDTTWRDIPKFQDASDSESESDSAARQIKQAPTCLLLTRTHITMDAESSTTPPKSLFFSGSDDEEAAMDTTEERQDPVPSASGSGQNRSQANKLFFADSDDEDETNRPSFATPQKRDLLDEKENSSSDIEIPNFEEVPRTSSPSIASSVPSPKNEDSSPAPSIEIIERPKKKRRLSLPVASQATFDSIYIGSFIVGNAWSTVKGKGYIKSGEEINVEREDQDDKTSKGTTGSSKGKPTKQDKGKKKQLSIATMMKAQPPKMNKKKVNTVVRLTNSRGFGQFILFVI